MSDYQTLLEKLRGSPDAATEVIPQLAEMGAPVVPAVIAAMRTSTPFEGASLQKVLLRMNDPAVVPLLIDALGDENRLVRVTAFRALGGLKDKRALKPLLAQLQEAGNSSSAREWAADALGDLGDRRMVRPLLGVTRELLGGEDIEDQGGVITASIKALAKLGNQEMAAAAISLAEHDDEMVRTSAVDILKYLVGPGLFGTLEKKLRDDDGEIRWKAAEALSYLGVREAIAALIGRVDDKDLEVRALVINRLRDLTGEEFDDDLTARRASAWWKKHQASFKSGVTYRLGKPLKVAVLVELLKDEPTWRGQIMDELLLITGRDFGVAGKHFPREEKKFYPLVRNWWRRQKPGRFKPGRIYKYGYEQNTQVIFQKGPGAEG